MSAGAVRILLVDDDRELIDLLAFALKRAGLEPIAAHDAAAALRAFDERNPDLVVLDINLGAENGLDLVAWMRQKPERREIPVIAVTAHALVAEQEQILKAGCRACLSKPIDFRLLRKELNRWLQGSKMSQINS